MTNSRINKLLERDLDRLAAVTDKLGMPIDAQIIRPVAALRRYSFFTISSCEGHWNRRTGGPYITFESPEAPAYEEKLKQLVFDGPEFNALRNELMAKNLQERARFMALLDEYYGERTSPVRITIRNIGPGTTKLRCHDVESAQQLDPETKKIWLRAAQTEFNDFADWLVSRLVS